MSNPPADICHYESPLGWITIVAGPGGISQLNFIDPEGTAREPDGLAADCVRELRLYFAGNLKNFNIPLNPSGTSFQLKVWDELVKIPYGQVITYRDLAKKLGGPTYTRIVGQANARNPLSILIPCHRVIGMNGALTGYAGGLWRKKILLELEQKGSSNGFSPVLF